MILVVGNTKGGVGKSTIAVNIAIARTLSGKKVVLVDGDQQKSSALFTSLRTSITGAEDYAIKCIEGENIYHQMTDLVKEYDDIVIDVGGWDSDSLRYSLLIADTVLMPVLPQNFGTWAIPDMVAIVGAANKARRAEGVKEVKLLAVLNKAHSSNGKDNQMAALDVSDAGIELLPVVIVERAAFNNAAAVGKSVLEHKPKNKKAVAEISELMLQLYN